jgi:hypothetical protein
MSAIPYEDDHEETWDGAQEDTLTLPGRRRRQYFNRRSAALIAVITCAAGFYAGIRVEKSQVTSSSATTAGFTPPSLTGAAGRSGSRGSTGSAASRSASTGGFPGAAGGFPGGALAGANASIGTIASVDGKTIYVTTTSGNTVKVTLSSATKISKSLTVAKNSLRPGDSVVIRGLNGSSGKISATSISDSGASNNRSSGAGAGGGTGATGGSAPVNSLFGSGSGG